MRMCHGAAHEYRMQHVRQDEVGDELAAAGQQALVLAAQDGAADEGCLVGCVHARDAVEVMLLRWDRIDRSGFRRCGQSLKFSRSVDPPYLFFDSPRRCNSGTTSSTNSRMLSMA